jgi:pimeloyl-ACP methyl ester carboxylesterase
MAFWDWAATEARHPERAVICVHGLSRQGRDFDALSTALSQHVRVVCPDVAGRGRSDWLKDPMDYQIGTYVQDMLSLVRYLKEQGVTEVDWVGTSMGGVIGIALAGAPGVGLRRLVLNDVGPNIEVQALIRIGQYLGLPLLFDGLEHAASYLQSISVGFGPHTSAQWRALTAPMIKHTPEGWVLHYDPAIAEPFKALTVESATVAAQHSEQALWALYDAIHVPTLLLRGQDSDLLSATTAAEMTRRGPYARLRSFDGVGHAPTLVAPDQVQAVMSFLFEPDACDASV